MKFLGKVMLIFGGTVGIGKAAAETRAFCARRYRREEDVEKTIEAGCRSSLGSISLSITPVIEPGAIITRLAATDDLFVARRLLL